MEQSDKSVLKDQQVNSIDEPDLNATLYYATPAKPIAPYVPKKTKISYDKFKEKAQKVFNDLKAEKQGFVLIHTFREKMKKIDRSDFNYYLPKMQEDNLFPLRTGGLELSDQQKNDSLYLPAKGMTTFIAAPEK